MPPAPVAFVRQPGEGIANAAFHLPRRLLVTAEDSGGHSSQWIEEVPAGIGPPLHVHHHEDEAFHILGGSFRFMANGVVHEAGSGATVFIPRGTPHTFKNIGDGAGRLFVTMTPGGFEKFFLAVEAAGLQPETAMAEIVALAERHGLTFVGPPL